MEGKRWVQEIIQQNDVKVKQCLMERPGAQQHEVAASSTSTTHVSFSARVAQRLLVEGGRGRKNDNGRGEVVDAGGPLVPGFTDCDQGCRFVILAAGPSSVFSLAGACLPLQCRHS